MSTAIPAPPRHFPLSIRFTRAVVQMKIQMLKFFCQLTGHRGAAWFLLATSDWKGYRKGQITVLCLYRPLFSKDLDQLRLRTDINWVYLNNEFLGHVQSAWMPADMRRQTDYQKCRGERYRRYWERLEDFGILLLKRFGRKARIDAVLSSHIDYWHAEGVRLGARRLGVPFLALCREHMCLPIQQQSVKEYYTSFRFEGDAVAVFSRATRDIFVASGACSSEQVVVTGPPRLDIWREVPERIEPRDYIVLLSYRDPAYWAPHSFVEVLHLFKVAAERHENGESAVFLVKSKNREDTQEIISLIPDRPRNLVIEHDVSLYELLPRARLVVGFNSLSLFEAHFTHAWIVVPYWADARRPSRELILDPEDDRTREVIGFAMSPMQLDEWLKQAALNRLPPPVVREKRLEIVRRAFHFPVDRTCSQEVADFVLENVQKRAKAFRG